MPCGDGRENRYTNNTNMGSKFTVLFDSVLEVDWLVLVRKGALRALQTVAHRLQLKRKKVTPDHHTTPPGHREGLRKAILEAVA